VRGIAKHEGKFVIIPNLGPIFSGNVSQSKEPETEVLN